MKYLFLILMIFSISSLSGSFKETPLERIYVNRCHLIYVRSQLNFKENSFDTTEIENIWSCKSKKSEILMEVLIDSSYSKWKEKEAEILREFIEWYLPYVNRFKRFRYYIEDSITVSILISFLDYPDYREQPKREWYSSEISFNWSRDAIKFLTDKVYFRILKKQSKEILERLSRCKEPEQEKLKLFVLCDVPQKTLKQKLDSIDNYRKNIEESIKVILNIKDSLVKKYDAALDYKSTNFFELRRKDYDSISMSYKDTLEKLRDRLREIEKMPLWVRARLGDKRAEGEIIKILRNEENGKVIMRYAREATLVWTDSCKRAFFELFNRDIPKCSFVELRSKTYQHCRSVYDSLLIYLARHHPEDRMFGVYLSASIANADFCREEEQLGYFVEFSKWVKNKYGYEITYKGFKPYFWKDFSRDRSVSKELCK